MTKAQRVGVLAVLGVAACGPGPAQPAELRELCGEIGPVKVLELEESQRLWGDPRVVDGRWIFSIADLGEPERGGRPVTDTTTIWSTDACGGAPEVIGAGVRLLGFEFEDRWPDALIGLTASDDLVWLDPHGDRQPHVVFEAAGRNIELTDHGLVATRGEHGEVRELVVYPYPTDLSTATSVPWVAVPSVRAKGEPFNDFLPQVFDDRAYAIDTDSNFVSVDLADGTIRLERPEVRLAMVSPEQGYLAWQDLPMTNDDEEWPRGEVWLRDTATGIEASMGDSSLSYDYLNMKLADDGVMWLRKEANLLSDVRVYSLPSMQWVDVAGFGYGSIHNGELIATSVTWGPYAVVDPLTGAKEVLFDGVAHPVRWRDGRGFLEGVRCCIDPQQRRKEGPLWQVPETGAEPQHLAHRATLRPIWTEDERIVTAVDVGGDWLGAVITVEPDTLEELLIDTEVHSGGLYDADALFPNTVAYSVDDPQRRGVWLARLADE